MRLNISNDLPGVLGTYSWKTPIRELIEAFNQAIIPPERLTVSQWAEKNRNLSSEASAQKGQWYSWPFQKEPMDILSSYDPTKIVVLQCASQMLKTEAILNMLGYVICVDPGPVLIVEPREMDAESLSKDRVSPMIRDTPALKVKFFGKRGLANAVDRNDKGNTTAHKRFPGGHVTFVGANSPSGLAMRPIRYLLMDEVDRYPISVGKEGDPINIVLNPKFKIFQILFLDNIHDMRFESDRTHLFAHIDTKLIILICCCHLHAASADIPNDNVIDLMSI
jgi:phage terminase large subunit GpA-like protein